MSVNETTSLVPLETRKAAASPRTSSGSAQRFSWPAVVIPAGDKLNEYEVRAHSIALRAHDHASHAPYCRRCDRACATNTLWLVQVLTSQFAHRIIFCGVVVVTQLEPASCGFRVPSLSPRALPRPLRAQLRLAIAWPVVTARFDTRTRWFAIYRPATIDNIADRRWRRGRSRTRCAGSSGRCRDRRACAPSTSTSSTWPTRSSTGGLLHTTHGPQWSAIHIKFE